MGLRSKINAFYSGASAVLATSYEGFPASAVRVIILDSQAGSGLRPRRVAAVEASGVGALFRDGASGKRRGRRPAGHRAAVLLRWVAVSPLYLLPGLLLGGQFLAFEAIAAVIGVLVLVSRRFRPAPLYDYPAWMRRLAAAVRVRLWRRQLSRSKSPRWTRR